MIKSDSIKNLAVALITFHVKVDKVQKDAKNPFFKSKYASLSNILETINDPLNESGLTFCQFPSGEHGLHTILMHADSGEFISAEYTMRPTKDDPQGLGSCITYQRRYALAAILGLNIDDDDDGNAASVEYKKSEPETKKVNGAASKEEKPWLNKTDPLYFKIINSLQNKTRTIQQIEQHYKLNKQIRAELEAACQTDNLIPEKQLN